MKLFESMHFHCWIFVDKRFRRIPGRPSEETLDGLSDSCANATAADVFKEIHLLLLRCVRNAGRNGAANLWEKRSQRKRTSNY